ncbi:VapC toxin family PIN domain ribonuclease [Acidiferrobacter sp. SPIII_3]|uniref:type II toxin-antitoxin system VapC family toxin n=1 Tax=Acidiferrobacter sp. SPIII_3 TaxID=1281578 RepID=UPI000D729F6C|nr:VapC toxin family PIN domain ribonuclease [Acidiferrobacter sp. SPIII_3]
MMYVLDTNTLIYFFRGQGTVAERLLATSPTEVAIPAISAYELEVGIAKSTQPAKRRRQFDELLRMVTVLPFDRATAAAAARVRAMLEKAGQPIGPLDTLIAGTALAHRATLVTHNTREFRRVSKLALIDWYG